VFAAGAYAYGSALRGLDVILNEVAIVRGAPDATEGTAQVYLGVFSPSRGTYQLDIPGGALVSSTLTGDFSGDTAVLDVLEGDPARIRDLAVGFGSLRTVRAETAAVVPRLHADLALAGGTLRGTIQNLSAEVLEKPAVVLGGSVVVLRDLQPGGQQSISLPIRSTNPGESLSDRILGPTFFGDPSQSSTTTQQALVRHSIVDQLTFDPSIQASTLLQSDSPVLLAWGTRRVLDVRVSGQLPRRTGNVLYFIPLSMRVHGPTVFEGDLIRNSLVSVEGAFFNKDPFSINMGRGTVTVAYRPVAFDGALTPRRLVLGLTFGGDMGAVAGARTIEPLNPQPCRNASDDLAGCIKVPTAPAPTCDPGTQDCNQFQGNLPDVEVFDRTLGGKWLRLPAFAPGTGYELKDPARYIDPGSATLLVRFINDKNDGVGFGFQVRLEGDVE
jgi:hypothetical protein